MNKLAKPIIESMSDNKSGIIKMTDGTSHHFDIIEGVIGEKLKFVQHDSASKLSVEANLIEDIVLN